MDYCSIDSEIIESLDYLRPPVKRINYPFRDKLHNATHINHPNDIKILKSYRKKFTKYENSHTNKAGVESSTSLILQKTSEQSIFEKYSIISYTNIQRSNENPMSFNNCTQKNITSKNKPLIKVTVIPKPVVSEARLMRKRRQQSVKRVQTTVSNQENSIHTKNVYLVVAGRRKEKVYELKTTGSAKLSNDHSDFQTRDEELSVKELPHLKYILNSLNMDKKKKKNRKKKEMSEAITSQKVGDMLEECVCPYARNGVRAKDLESHKSHVTIYGRVGLTEDERYVMDYSATINNRRGVPAENFVQVERDSSRLFSGINRKAQKSDPYVKPPGRMDGNKTDFYSNKRDSFVQARFPDDNACYKLMDRNPFDRSPIRSKESQATQVDFHINLTNNAINQPQNKDQSVQCKCNDIEKLVDNVENNNVKECQSPFVTISVYPKQDPLEVNKPMKLKLGDSSNRRLSQRNKETNYGGYVKERGKSKTDIETKKNIRSPRRSRSPSPKADNKKNIDSKFRKANIASKETGQRTINFQERAQQNNSKKFFPYKTVTQVYRQETENAMLKSYEDKGTNTDHWLTKKALVDQYTKQFASQMKHVNKVNPKGISGSKVTESIDGKNEKNEFLRCNVQKKRARKNTASHSPPQHYQSNIDSMENFLKISENVSRNSRSPTTGSYNNWPTDDIANKSSRIHVRDSIEICLRREDNSGKNIKNTQTSHDSKNRSNDTKYFAPIKHYTGDKCAIPNPVTRDKEIRELLGVLKGREKTSRPQNPQTRAHSHRSHIPVKCYYQETRDRNILSGFTVMNCPCKCCRDKRNNTKLESEDSQSIEKEQEEIKSHKRKTMQDQNDISHHDRTSLYQQMILNRNIQVFLQVEQFTKQKPIVLSRKQYDKVKRTIEQTISRTQHKRKNSIDKGSIVSVGEVRRKSKRERSCNYNKEAQANIHEVPDSTSASDEYARRKSSKRKSGPKKHLCTTSDENTDGAMEHLCGKARQQSIKKIHDHKKSRDKGSPRSKNELLCICPENVDDGVRQAVSSMEIRYASVAYMKRVSFSATNVGNSSIPLTYTQNSSSLHTIFKGHRKSPTTNLGTSAFSLYSEINPDSKILKILMPPREPKPKKPFLKRLMSCLVMRSTRDSEVKTFVDPAPLDPSAESSIDSYHFSTSLGAVEISSSLYDTSASFYSSHAIHPVTSKMKRGFFSSVRGFLNRKS